MNYFTSATISSAKSVAQNTSDNNAEFDFKFISQSDFNSIYKSVLRRRREELEKKKWDLFIKKKAVEEVSKKVKFTEVDSVDSAVQCTNDRMSFNNCRILKNDKPNSMPQNLNSVYDESLETHRNELHLQIPSCEHENLNDIIQREFVENLRTIHPEIDHQNIPNSGSFVPSIDNKTYDVADCLDLEFLSLESDLCKVHSLREKMLSSLDNINGLMIQGPDYSDAEEIDRIKVRSTEFSNRFKRNYLYRMQCSVNDVDKILNDKQKLLTSKENLVQKFISGHQTGLLTLQIIEKHLPKITVNAPFSVLNEFFTYISEFSKKFISVFRGKSKDAEDDIAKMCQRVIATMTELIKVKPRPQKVDKGKKKVKDRLWMYSTKNAWVNKTLAVSRKSTVTSKYQNVQQKKINLPQDVQRIDNKSELIRNELIEMNKKSKLNFRKRDAIVEDEIKTMVEMTGWDQNYNSDAEEQDSNLNGYQMIQADSEEEPAVQLGTIPALPLETEFITPTVESKLAAIERKPNNVALIHVKSNSEEK